MLQEKVNTDKNQIKIRYAKKKNEFMNYKITAFDRGKLIEMSAIREPETQSYLHHYELF